MENDLNQQMEQLVTGLAELASSVNAAVDSLTSSLEQATRPIVQQWKDLAANMAPILEELARRIRELPERNRKVLLTLAEQGWYLDPWLSIPDLFKLSALFDSGQAAEANDLLCGHFDNRCQEFETLLANKWAKRARLLQFAFEAHRRRQYALSVPVFLAQSDGMCQELTGFQLYSRRNGDPQLAAWPELDNFDPLLKSLLTPLIEPTIISASQKEHAGQVDKLNRHAVLHGESLDYDTRLNSCRSISLLIYIEWALALNDK